MPSRNGINKAFSCKLPNLEKPIPRSFWNTARFYSELLIISLLLESNISLLTMLGLLSCFNVEGLVSSGQQCWGIHIFIPESRSRLKWLFIASIHTQTCNSSLMDKAQGREGERLPNGMLSCMSSGVSRHKFDRFLFVVLKFLPVEAWKKANGQEMSSTQAVCLHSSHSTDFYDMCTLKCLW